MSRVPQEYWAAIADFYLEFRDGMIKFAVRLLGSQRHLAHDAVQETFQAAALQWAVLRNYDESRQRAWLYRVLKNKVFDHWGNEQALGRHTRRLRSRSRSGHAARGGFEHPAAEMLESDRRHALRAKARSAPEVAGRVDEPRDR
ncbi:sigma factor [Streptomyces sp. Lzd4kr]|nr:sigma factor [Streptomyces sp. Lzd4kr]